jgi:acetolactate synthase-1/2/3 large subunit
MHYEKTTTKKIYAEAIVDFLVEKKLTHVFDLTGGMIAYLEDAISRKEGIECVPMHHEQAAGFAAEGYARMGQNFGVAIATSGPGAMNLMTAIGSCYFDSIPTLFITGQVHTDNIKKNNLVRQEGFQETDVVSIVKNITKYAVLVTNPDMIIYELEKAYYSMKRGRLGPVLVDIPINLQRTEVDFKMSKHFFGSKEHRQLEKEDAKFTKKIESKKVNELQALLKKSKAPLVVVGHGIQLSKTPQELDLFVKNNNIPVVSSLMGLDALPQTNKLHIGYIGSNGNRNANIVFANADLIIALGTRLDIRQTGDPKFFNRSARFHGSRLHIADDPSARQWRTRAVLLHQPLSIRSTGSVLLTYSLQCTRKQFSILRRAHVPRCTNPLPAATGPPRQTSSARGARSKPSRVLREGLLRCAVLGHLPESQRART